MSTFHDQLRNIKNQENLYQKKHKTFEEQLQILKERKLKITNDDFVLTKLKHINYYRMSAYFLPFQYPKNSINKNQFLFNTTFEDILSLYYFDCELRKIVFEAIESIEIYFRTQIAYFHSQSYDAFGYLELKNFRENKIEKFDELQADILKEKSRSKEFFIKHFKEKYNSYDLPVWSVVEIISFGTLSKFYMILKEKEQNEVIQKIKGINKLVFYKWFHALSSVRNICAHHSRLWNRTLGVSFEIPKGFDSFEKMEKSKNKLFFSLSVIEYLLTCIGEDEVEFKMKLKNLLQKYPNIKIEQMGFINNWEENPIWKE
ncbi:MAG: Abi family protein [Candidatus Marinarcus sp.]|uniref:Abi family protein n=1 Tax=Candidatus Marinarcus sp. TaxID=3100987 RepID=UPI003AFFD076